MLREQSDRDAETCVCFIQVFKAHIVCDLCSASVLFSSLCKYSGRCHKFLVHNLNYSLLLLAKCVKRQNAPKIVFMLLSKETLTKAVILQLGDKCFQYISFH